jgi:hypothetical protein
MNFSFLSVFLLKVVLFNDTAFRRRALCSVLCKLNDLSTFLLSTAVLSFPPLSESSPH